jgi:hypothetical protein
MGPNIKCFPRMYWDFWNHYLALTEQSFKEVLELVGFNVELALRNSYLIEWVAEACTARVDPVLFEVALGPAFFCGPFFVIA